MVERGRREEPKGPIKAEWALQDSRMLTNLSFATVKPTTETGVPSTVITAPAAPFTKAG